MKSEKNRGISDGAGGWTRGTNGRGRRWMFSSEEIAEEGETKTQESEDPQNEKKDGTEEAVDEKHRDTNFKKIS